MKRFLFACLMVFAVSPALAENVDVEVIGTYKDWTAYAFQEKGGKVCYIASDPEKAEGNYSRRGDIFALVTHRPADEEYDVVSIIAGYSYKKNSDVTVKIGKKEFSLFTHEDRAWARNATTDKALVKAMEGGANMVVKGTSSRGTATTDTYSLMGFTAAHKAINEACSR